MDNVLRRFFGLRSNKQDEKFADEFHGFGQGNGLLGDLDGFSIFQHFDRLFADMNDMLAQFESATLNDSTNQFDAEIPKRFNSPRDELLKHPDLPQEHVDPEIKSLPSRDGSRSDTFAKRWWMWPDWDNYHIGTCEDSDIDEEIKTKKKGILELTPSLIPGKVKPNGDGPLTYRSSITSITVQANGKVEHRRTVRDIHGNEETTITRTDESGNTITTWHGGDNEASKEFITSKPDEESQQEVEKFWPTDRKPSCRWRAAEHDPSYERIFRNLFGNFLPRRE